MSKVINLKEKKEKLNKRKVIVYIILTIIVIYIISAVYLIIKTPTDTVTVTKGVLTFEESTTGYIIRDEKIVKGKKYKNGISQIISEGEKTAKKEPIFRYYGDNEEKIEKQIENINLKIQNALEKESTIFSSDVKNIEDQLEIKMKNLKQESDVQKIAELKKDINNLIVKKSNIVGESSPRGSYIKKLINQREKYEKKLTSGTETVKAPISGIVSYKVDGLENILTTNNFSNLTEESLEKLDLKTGKIISTSNESAKVIDNFGCYIATILDSTAAKDAKEGDKVKITLSSGNEVVAEVNYKKQQDDGKVLIVFKIDVLTDELISYRKISINITWWSVSGLKIPNDAITEGEDGYKYVVKKTTKDKSQVLVKVLKTNNKYSIISTYSKEDLNALGIDVYTDESINIYDKLIMYPEIK